MADPVRPADPTQTDPNALGGGVSLGQAILRSACQLDLIAKRLRELEGLLLADTSAAAQGGQAERSALNTRLQGMDLTLQELAGLSLILRHISAFAPDEADPRVAETLDLPRLDTLSRGLRGEAVSLPLPEIVIF